MGKDRRYVKKTRRSRPGARRPSRKSGLANPRIDSSLKPVFERIGVPETAPFAPDPFQLEALELVPDYDVLVSAPTGAGKTWIAAQVIAGHLNRGLRVWYASPLKALSNSIYQEFCREFGAAACGILTGDRKENADAPVIVGTTEILRNQLYDAMTEGTSIGTHLVILDEAHYLSDPDRGVVWEEVLIYLPHRVRLLLLSATISNAAELCEWLGEIRGVPNRVVRAHERPVPLEMLFLFPDGLVAPLEGKRGLNPKVKKYVAGQAGRRSRKPRIDHGEIIGCLRRLDLLPAIFFLKSRSDCDQAVLNCPPAPDRGGRRGHLGRELEQFLKSYPHLRRHRQRGPLVKSLVGSHHGGQLPLWKMLVEKMMNRGYLEAIFSTSTVAAGVNFPARTVVLVQSDRYNGRDFIDLSATELHQMVGRAGRRGKDRIGFGLVVPGLYQDPALILELKDSPPEPIVSQIRINFSMTLNLLLSHSPGEVKDLLERSFAAFQQKDRAGDLSRQWRAMRSRLAQLIPESVCDRLDPYEVLELVQHRRELHKKINQLTRKTRWKALAERIVPYLTRGRLFRHRNKDLYVVFHPPTDRGRAACAAYNIKRTALGRKGQMRFKKVPLSHIRTLYDYQVFIPEDADPEQIHAQLKAIPRDRLRELPPGGPETEPASPDVDRLQREMDLMPCARCPHRERCHRGKRDELSALLQKFEKMAPEADRVEGGLWLSFKRHVRFLRETGFVSERHQLTPDGHWASKLRLDQPLLIAEAIRQGALEGGSPAALAGGLAPFVWDRAQEVVLSPSKGTDLREIESVFNRTLLAIQQIREKKARRGFESPPIMFWPAAALFLWSRGMGWEELMDVAPVDEGDMASLVLRTADHLRQVMNLRETHPGLAATAGEAIESILREPAVIY